MKTFNCKRTGINVFIEWQQYGSNPQPLSSKTNTQLSKEFFDIQANNRVWIHSETRTWHDSNIQSNVTTSLSLSLSFSLFLSLFLQGAWLSFRILLYVYNVINENKTNHLDLLNTEQDKFPQDVLRHVHIVCNKYIFCLFNFIKTLNIHKNNIVSHRLPKTCETSGKPPV